MSFLMNFMNCILKVCSPNSFLIDEIGLFFKKPKLKLSFFMNLETDLIS